MRSTQNQLDRFRTIAKRLVDEHSAEVFTRTAISSEGRQNVLDDVYYSHLDVLGKELNEQAEQFITSFKTVNEDVKSEIWTTCRRYIDQFIKRNQPSYY
jgi:hypothetical protein